MISHWVFKIPSVLESEKIWVVKCVSRLAYSKLICSIRSHFRIGVSFKKPRRIVKDYAVSFCDFLGVLFMPNLLLQVSSFSRASIFVKLELVKIFGSQRSITVRCSLFCHFKSPKTRKITSILQSNEHLQMFRKFLLFSKFNSNLTFEDRSSVRW